MLTAIAVAVFVVFAVMVNDAATVEIILESAFSMRGVVFTSVFPAGGFDALFSCDEIPTFSDVAVVVVFVADVVIDVVIVVALVVTLFDVTVGVVVVVVVAVIAFVVAAMTVKGFAPITLAAVVVPPVDGTEVVVEDVDFATTLGFTPMTCAAVVLMVVELVVRIGVVEGVDLATALVGGNVGPTGAFAV